MTANETIDRLLAAARATMSKVTDCWAATPSVDGGVSVRVVVPIAGIPGEEDWTVWFATHGGSRKATEIRRSGRLTLGCQHHPDRAYVALMGRAALVEDRREIRGRWREAWRMYFPGGPDDPDTIFVKLTVERIELCVPGISRDPFGTRHDTLERDAERRWRVVE
jgi:general stress protein 26